MDIVVSRSSHQRCYVKNGVLRNFAKFTGKNLCEFTGKNLCDSHFFNKVASLRAAALLKMILWHRCFPVNFAKFLRTPFLQNTSRRLLSCSVRKRVLNNFRLKRATLLKKRLFDRWVFYILQAYFFSDKHFVEHR